jgi:hypothetical protein
MCVNNSEFGERGVACERTNILLCNLLFELDMKNGVSIS